MAEAKSYAERNRQGNDWFTHEDGDGSKKPPSSPQHKPEEEEDVAGEKCGEDHVSRMQMIKPVCNSNEWFKHDKPGSDGDTKEVTSSASAKDKCHPNRQSGGDWYSHEGMDNEKPSEVKVRVGSTEGQAYCQRDKTGSSSSWFAHEHDGEAKESPVSSPRVNTTEGSSNATRMRSQSENWFSHEEKVDQNGPQHTSKGRGNRPQSSDMHQVFHMGTE